VINGEKDCPREGLVVVVVDIDVAVVVVVLLLLLFFCCCCCGPCSLVAQSRRRVCFDLLDLPLNGGND
jgi:hypothetical protein